MPRSDRFRPRRRAGSPIRRSGLAGAVSAALLAGAIGGAGAAPDTLGEADEYQLKAAFLLNLAKFVEWPAEALGPRDAPLQLCLIGRDPFAASWREFDDQHVHGRALQLRRIAEPTELPGCHMVFVTRSESPRLRALLPALATQPVLTISDIQGFAEAGGAVELLIADHRLQFDVNWATLRRAGLRMGAAALRLARSVIGLRTRTSRTSMNRPLSVPRAPLPTHPPLRCGDRLLDLSTPRLMGIVNVTPDSFSDGGRHLAVQDALAHGRRLAEEGAAIIDIGGESTRPGATPVPPEEELRRVLPVVEGLAADGLLVSIDTRNTQVMKAAIAAGARLVNDVNALRAPGALEACASADVAVCLMHMLGDPQTMQVDPHYRDVGAEVTAFLAERAATCRRAGIAADRICVDPGFGFGKTVAHNLSLLRALPQLVDLGYPVLAGLSRKSVLGAVTGRGPDDRVHASVAAALLAVLHGARLLRVHDVAATRNALAVWTAVMEEA